MSVPTNLIPTKITGLPEYTGTSQAGYFPYVLDGSTYKVQFSNIASAGEVPPSRTLTAGTGLVGGGDLSANRIFAIANGGVGANQLDTTGVVAGVYGNGSNVPTVTVDANGRVTSVTTSPVVATGYVPESRTITAGTGLIGGGSLANNITLSLNLSSATPQALGTATAGVSTAAARGDHVHPAVNLSDTNETQGALPLGRGGTGDALSPVAGAVVYSTGTKFALTNPGIPGQVLTSNGTDEPLWTTIVGTGTVTSVNASGGTTGMTFTGGPVTTIGTLTLGGTLGTANGGTGVTGTPTNGQLLIGNGAGYTLAALTAGTGVSVGNAAGAITITNTAPDQIVSLTAGTAISVTGTYPNFTIGNTAPDQIVSLTGAGTTTISGTYPNFTITSNDQFVGTVTSVAASGGTTGLTFSGSPITSAGTLTLGGTLAIGSGGTGASTAGAARTALGAAALGANTDITSIALTSGTIQNAPTSGTDIVNKAYADSIASGINFHQSVRLATVAPLPANTYNNGSSGVGATLTANANGALSIDGVAVVAGNRVLVKNEAAQANNGVYVVTQTGSGSTPYILTRATDFDSAGSGVDQIDAGDFFLVTAGSTLANTSWVQQTPLPITVGTTAIVFSQFGAPVLYTAGTGLTLAGTVFSITNTGVTASTYGSASQVPVLAVNAQGQITSASSTSIAIDASQVTSGALAVARGGTALSTTPTNGQLLIGNGTGYSLSTLSAGTGVSVTNGSGSVTVTNTAPDQIVTLTGGGSTSISGTYPNFTITSTAGTGTVTSVAASGGTTGLTFTGSPITTSGTLTLGGTLNVANGGTGTATAFTAGSVVFAGASGVYSQDNANLFWDDANNRLGIGTSSPAVRLDVRGGDLQVSRGAAGVAADAAINFGSSTANYIYSGNSTNLMAFATNAAERMRITAAGNVGIGLSAPSYLLHVGGRIASQTSTSDWAFLNDASGGAVRGGLWVGSGGDIGVTNATVANGWFASSSVAYAITNFSERMRITAAGDVGIGTNSPGSTLDVAGTIRTSAGGSDPGTGSVFYFVGSGAFQTVVAGAAFAVNTGANNTRTERMRISIDGSTTLNVGGVSNTHQFLYNESGAEIQLSDATGNGPILIDNSGGLARFYKVGAGGMAVGTTGTGAFQFLTNNTERMRIDSAGSVGIGTSSPRGRLTVGAGAVGGNPTHSGDIVVRSGMANLTSQGGIEFQSTTFSNGFGFRLSTPDFGGGSTPLVIESRSDSAAWTERMRITAAGNVGIGTTNPTERLDTGSGNTRTQALVISGDQHLFYGASATEFGFRVGTGGPFYGIGTTGSNNMRINSSSGGDMLFAIGSTERARINSSGEFLVGTSSGGRTVCINAADNWIRQSNPSRSWLTGPSTGTTYMIWDETGGGARFTVDTSGNWFGNNAIILGSGFNNDNRIEVGQGRTGNNFAYIDLIGDTTYTDFGLRLLRGNGGANTFSQLYHRGTGGFEIGAVDAAHLAFITSNTERFRITSTGAITSSDLADAVGYKGIPQNARTSAYTLALSDIGRHISITTGGVTIPANGSVAFPIGSAVTIYNNSASNQTISITTDTLRLAGTATTGSRTLAQRGICTCVKVAATEWVISGAGLT